METEFKKKRYLVDRMLYPGLYILAGAPKKKRYLVDRMLYPGLYILAGAPKVGKSWLAMQLCVSVALGEQFLKHETSQGQAVYLALEDDEGRLQDRVYEFIDVPTENLEFAIASEYIDSGLENQIRTLGETHDNLKLVIIDTMQKVRETTDMSYAKDYKDMSVLKDLATKRENVCKPDQERTQPTGHFV